MKKSMPVTGKKRMNSDGPKSGSGNPFTGPSSPAKKSAFTEAAKKRMKADAEKKYAPINPRTRVLPEMSGKLTKKSGPAPKKK